MRQYKYGWIGACDFLVKSSHNLQGAQLELLIRKHSLHFS
jgi:hypothetical protein